MLSKIVFAALIIAPLVAPMTAMAGSTGYSRHGQTVIVYKDGKKVGDWPASETADDRVPAAVGVPNDTLYFIDDSVNGHTVRCYAMSNAIGFNKSEPIACVRTD